MTPPADSSSLLVPIDLDAWVLDSSNQELLAWYEAEYAKNLPQFASPIVEKPERPAGIHLHWALPDALTRGRKADAGGSLEFPFVPNRWLVARFGKQLSAGKPPTDLPFKAWVVQSDAVQPSASRAGSAFLDPDKPTYMQPLDDETNFEVNEIRIGFAVSIDAWEANPAPAGRPFLTAVGPANPSFAAYMPFSREVFAFMDREADLPAPDTGHYAFTYMVVGWFADPASMDPLRGVDTYVEGVWASEAAWQAQTPKERFETLLADARWSLGAAVPEDPPATSLYHGTVADVPWPLEGTGAPPVDPGKVTIAVGNTSADALAALIEAYAESERLEPAGANLAGLVQATMLDALDVIGTPGGSARLEQRVEESWFGSAPGGTTWAVVANPPQAAGEEAGAPQLTPQQEAALDAQLAALNEAQREYDEAARRLTSLRETLYGIWLRLGIGGSFELGQGPPNWGELEPLLYGGEDGQGGKYAGIYPTQVKAVSEAAAALAESAKALPDPTAPAAADGWANATWSFPASEGTGTMTLSALGLGLKAGTDGAFFHPNDPVVLISGANRAQRYGEDGRFNEDGTLTCRLPGESIAGVQVTGQPAVTAAALQAHALDQDPLASYTQVPSVPSLVTEAYLADPENAAAMAAALGVDAAALATGIQSLLELEPSARTGSWLGVPPAPFALADGSQQAWAPLFLEWVVDFYPTGTGSGPSRPFAIGDWRFDGQTMHWQGNGFESEDVIGLGGRTLVTPQAPLLFKRKLEGYLKSHAVLDTPQMESLLATVGEWDLLSQSLGGFTDQLLTLSATETFPPWEPGSAREDGDSGAPEIATLVDDEYRHMPTQYSSRTSPRAGASYVSDFYPVRGGFLQFRSLKLVDVFGQTLELAKPNTERGFEPVLGQGLVPEVPAKEPEGFPVGAVQLAPRAAQDTRLELDFLANDGSGLDVATSADRDPICGWLMPNHLDGSIAVYDAGGIMLGELLPLSAPDNWRPRPGEPGSDQPPAEPSAIANATLEAVVSSIARQSPAVLGDVLETIDETLWTVDPLGGRKDQLLSVLFGRPLAVVQARLRLRRMGEPAFDQTWAAMSAPNPSAPPKLVWTRDAGDLDQVPFPVRLGDQDLRSDGLIGYYLPSESYSTLHTVHLPDDVASGDKYLERIVAAAPGSVTICQGGIALKVDGDPVTVTLVMDPRGPVHAFTGILPVKTATLPPHLIEDFVKGLAITFRAGPILTEPNTLRLPLPGRQHGTWDWVEATPTGWESDSIVAADETARLPASALQLREGWLRLTNVDESSKRSTAT